jgi:hypothetical protein
MKNTKLQLLLHGENIGMYSKVTITYPGVKVEKLHKAESANYIFVDLTISPAAKPGKFKIKLTGGGMAAEDISYELKQKNKENGRSRAKGVSAIDFIYLMIPDRFSNGDPSNDIIATTKPVSER